MRRGEIRLAQLDPVVGSEANKRRPVVVVSNDGANNAVVRNGRGVIVVVPLTSNLDTVWPFQVLLPGLLGMKRDSKAQVEQVRALGVERFGPSVGHVPLSLMKQVDDALRLHLML